MDFIIYNQIRKTKVLYYYIYFDFYKPRYINNNLYSFIVNHLS